MDKSKAYKQIVELKNYQGYVKKEWETGDGYFTHAIGFEILNPNNNKCVYREGSYNNNLDAEYSKYKKFDIFFEQNVIQ